MYVSVIQNILFYQLIDVHLTKYNKYALIVTLAKIITIKIM